jgi:hypothetical protein
MGSEAQNRVTVKRRRRRRLAAVFIAMPIVAVGGWLLLTRSVVTRWIGESILSSRLGVPVGAESIRLGADGSIHVERLEIRAAGISGEAGRFARAESVRVSTPWWRGLWGSEVPLRRVEVDGLVVRVSQSLDDGRANIPAFLITSEGGGDLPVVFVNHGRFEVGEHKAGLNAGGDAGFRTLRSLDLSGKLSPESTPGHYTFDLRGTDTRGAAGGGFTLKGTLDPDSVRARLAGVNREGGAVGLDALKPDNVPGPLRELFEKLNLDGAVSATTFEYRFPPKNAGTAEAVRGIDAAIELRGVAVTLPFEDFSSAAPAGQRYPRLSGVSGTIAVSGGELRADLDGKLEDLPAKITLRWKGASLDAPFEATVATSGFQLTPSPRLLPFMPPVVHKRLGMFSNPTGLVDSRVVVTRAVSGVEPKVSGTITIRQGTASFVKFPYLFRNLDGLFEFDDDSLRIVRVAGKADSGAEINVRGLITPLTDEAAVTLDITVTNVPVDESLARGLGPRRRGVLEALFNEDRHKELVATGLLVSAEEGATLSRELAKAKERLAGLEARTDVAANVIETARGEVARAESRAAVPIFALGGLGNVRLKLDTPFGKNMPWTQIIEIEIPRAGLLPKRFPLPIVAENVKLLVDDTVLSVEDGAFRSLRGGTATVHARADFTTTPAAPTTAPATPGTPLQRETDIQIAAKGIPFDDLLIHAIPAKDKPIGGETGDDARTLGDVLRGLRLVGTGDADVWIGDVAPGEIGFKAKVTFADAACEPGGLPLLTGLGGMIEVDDDSLAMTLAGAVVGKPDEGAASRGRLAVELSAAFPPADSGVPATFDTRIDSTGLDVSLDIERAVGLFSSKAGRTITTLRERYAPEGIVDVRTRVSDEGDEPVRVEVEASGGRDVLLTYAPALPLGAPPAGPVRVAMSPWSGSVRFVSRTGLPTLEFKSLKADLSIPETDGVTSAGSLTLDGSIEIADEIDAGRLSVGVLGARFESPLTRAVAAERLSPDFATFLHERNPRGVFDVAMTLARAFAAERGAKDTPWEVNGTLSPLSLAIHGETVDVECPSASGTVRFRRDGGTFEAIRLANEEWTATVDGTWTVAADGAPSMNAKISGESTGTPPSLMSLLPLTVRDLAGAVDLKVGGKIAFRDVDLSLAWPAANMKTSFPVPAFRVAGVVDFADAAADVGVLVTKADGSIAFRASRNAAGVVDYDATATLPRAHAAGIALTDLSATLKAGAAAGETLVPNVRANCHGGSVSVEASLRPVSPGLPDGVMGFETLISLGGVRLNGVLKDLSPERMASEPSPVIDGNITLGGTVGDPASRRGRGTLSAGGGSVLDMPVLLPLINFSNLQIPSGEPLDTALVSFFVVGPTVAVERVSVLSSGIELRGFGTVTWPGMDLNLVFNSRSNTRVPVITPILESFRNELVTTVVRGTVKEPKIGVEPFRSARAAFADLFASKTEADLLMSDLELRKNDGADRRRVTAPVETPR